MLAYILAMFKGGSNTFQAVSSSRKSSPLNIWLIIPSYRVSRDHGMAVDLSRYSLVSVVVVIVVVVHIQPAAAVPHSCMRKQGYAASSKQPLENKCSIST